ncbi:glycosyltransferase family 2 protein [Aureitalea sp. L0-47]|uniref:glycosyltransferase family 2 protein n=1 Tax=Aureitalea sp. L0-47 TaxID=2816962 RepID=UPI0022385DF5|nr:glycosyltransferase family 2 protein [Aureitalea sp. L0-47]MCW5520692.1 glycosyltransferase family 2 protein [Aureitalea sp. L0-47]
MVEFSVAIAVYNKQDYIGKTLESVLNQTYRNFEVIIVNDGSQDKSEEVILSFNDPRVKYSRQENTGAGAARNAAISKATKPWIALLDADDIWYPDYLEEQSRLIQKFPSEKVFATNSMIHRDGKFLTRDYSFTLPKEDTVFNFFEASLRDSLLNSSLTVVHSDVLSEVNYYDTSIKSGQDTDLWVKIGLRYNVVFSPKVCGYYEINETSLFESARKVSEKTTFEAYEHLEKDNKPLKKFLDLNRYSICMIAKFERNKEAFNKLYPKIDLNNLSFSQRLLLKMNRPLLVLAKKTQNLLSRLGIRLSSFK